MSVKLEVGKRYVDRDGVVTEIFAKNEANQRHPFIGVRKDLPDTPKTFCENGAYSKDGSQHQCDLIAEAPQTVNVWFCVDSDGKVCDVHLWDRETVQFHKIVGPVRVEVPR